MNENIGGPFGAAIIDPEGNVVVAVSYTHLDVYKRQFQ